MHWMQRNIPFLSSSIRHLQNTGKVRVCLMSADTDRALLRDGKGVNLLSVRQVARCSRILLCVQWILDAGHSRVQLHRQLQNNHSHSGHFVSACPSCAPQGSSRLSGVDSRVAALVTLEVWGRGYHTHSHVPVYSLL